MTKLSILAAITLHVVAAFLLLGLHENFSLSTKPTQEILQPHMQTYQNFSLSTKPTAITEVVYDSLNLDFNEVEVSSISTSTKPIDNFEIMRVKVNGKYIRRSPQNCLAANIYYETRSSSHEDQLGVSNVVINRTAKSSYPETICDVVEHHIVSGIPQFSWNKLVVESVEEEQQWERAEKLAKDILQLKYKDNTGGATHYHAYYVRPHWADSPKMQFIKRIGTHLYYKELN